MCNEDLLKNNFFTFNLIESNNILRRLDKLNDNNNNHENELEYKIIINNNIDKTSTIKLYSNNGEVIDLDIYSNISFEKNISTLIENNKAIEAIKSIEEKEINILDENDKVFNNFCEPLTIENYDIPLKDRKELLFIKEESLCGNKCYLENIFYNDLIYKCNCKIENGIIFYQNNEIKKTNIVKSTLSQNIKNYFQYLKCGLNREKIKYNAYLYILSIIFIGQLILLILNVYFLYRNSKIKIKGNPPK